MSEKTSAWTDEERADMAAQRERDAIDGGAYEMGPDGKPITWMRCRECGTYYNDPCAELETGHRPFCKAVDDRSKES